ncbi:MAG: carbon storage regulator CsrA [Ignavibacteriae bacterium]|nr:carbon storage regulator CsrA [Ignavibacteriota bacterium]
MLILTRKLNEAIQIGDNISLKVLHISEGQVKLGIEAPDDVRIFRAEIYAEIQKQNVLAASVKKSAAVKAAGLLAQRAKPAVEK